MRPDEMKTLIANYGFRIYRMCDDDAEPVPSASKLQHLTKRLAELVNDFEQAIRDEP